MSLDSDVKEALDVLRNGGTILYPTDTIWGIGCDATNGKAIERVYHIKERMQEKSLIILVKDLEMLRNYVKEVPETAEELINSIKDPLTIIYPEARRLPRNLLAPDGSIAIRIPNHEFCQKLLDAFGKPITSTSANVSGAANPFVFSTIVQPIKDAVDYIVPLKHQTIPRPKPSTIVKLDPAGEIRVIRN
ncbi:MAG: threonylcarbamoyl-AMP synthase [Bacteroidia bacterium]|nr:MAG: threonylcarbamoyl-AMP synthase [Bacteroidia bacterium]